jgi:hypothetical protein
MDEMILSPVPPAEPNVPESYVTPAVVYEASLEVRAGTTLPPPPPNDPLNLFGTGEK